MSVQERHGGDIYRNRVSMDFSINVNPFGMPDLVRDALMNAVSVCEKYPDIQAEKLQKAVSRMLDVEQSCLLFGNGASELFMALVHAIKPKKTMIPVPAFYGYEYVAEAGAGAVSYVQMPLEEKDFNVETFEKELSDDTELLFLANPNNPTGMMISRFHMEEIVQICRKKHIYVAVDECFMEFSLRDESMVPLLEKYDNLVVVRAFTKIFAIPGVRLGYLLCRNEKLLQEIKRQLPEWNLSVFAQEAGVVCATQTAYRKETAQYVAKERTFLTEKLESLGLRVFPSEANFLLFLCEVPLYEQLLEKGILIRDCKNFRGLSEGYYRVAVRKREENEKLWKAIGECIG